MVDQDFSAGGAGVGGLVAYEGYFDVRCVLQGNSTGCDLLGYFECTQ